jgi:hypothetical protein
MGVDPLALSIVIFQNLSACFSTPVIKVDDYFEESGSRTSFSSSFEVQEVEELDQLLDIIYLLDLCFVSKYRKYLMSFLVCTGFSLISHGRCA